MTSRAATEIFQSVEEKIVTGQFKDGTKLDEATLAEQFQVSRTPIREALLQLVGSGLATQIPKRGCFVKAPSIREMVEMFEVMSELEGMCARLAARRITNADSSRFVACSCEFVTACLNRLKSMVILLQQLSLAIQKKLRQSLENTS